MKIWENFEKNGYLDLKEITNDPFKSMGSISKILNTNKGQAMEIIEKINQLNRYKARS